jgi:hypothetical protein
MAREEYTSFVKSASTMAMIGGSNAQMVALKIMIPPEYNDVGAQSLFIF